MNKDIRTRKGIVSKIKRFLKIFLCVQKYHQNFKQFSLDKNVKRLHKNNFQTLRLSFTHMLAEVKFSTILLITYGDTLADIIKIHPKNSVLNVVKKVENKRCLTESFSGHE